MRKRSQLIFCTLLMLLPVTATAATSDSKVDDERLKLHTGARGKRCLDCHTDFQPVLERAFLHPLVKSRECTGCHDPHTSSEAGLLTSEPAVLCSSCHQEVLPEKYQSIHTIVTEGKCNQCHDSHGSENRSILLKSGNELCFECHQDIADQAKSVRFPHEPLGTANGCLNCHDPHASTRYASLLRKEAPLLCSQCHNTGGSMFQRQHQNYNVSDSNCGSCHNPHGSNQRGLVHDVAHKPLVEKACDDCHQKSDGTLTPAPKYRGIDLCRQCHEKAIGKMLQKDRIHWPMLDVRSCLTCHNPHAARYEKLVRQSTEITCGQCHADTVQLQESGRIDPDLPNFCEPVKKGECTTCHSAHSSDRILLFEKNSSIELCGECHEWETHSTHPIGEKVIDPRNKRLTMDCLSCHRGCGTTDYPAMLDFPTTYDLCVSCHVERKR